MSLEQISLSFFLEFNVYLLQEPKNNHDPDIKNLQYQINKKLPHMTEALLITNIYDEIIIFIPFNCDDIKFIFLLAYSSIDIFNEVRRDINKKFYPFIDYFMDYNISILHTPASFKFIFVSKNENIERQRDFMEGCHKIFLKVSISNLGIFRTNI
ncbi:hypothetical protein DMUE_4442 [Dictyocoela muelleri]|nr:hypothetical protein DMUE_4442 [Dictyocoela muelleri]